ncbi:MAG: MotA/TolQ/ExbB proton channel family protein [Planctomycetota bacterium]|nr:MotA/TolQ/ExbB proton channel family protein [Planctomycetota bacterium]
MNKLNQISAAIFRSPILWGLLLTFLFYIPIRNGQITDPTVLRYLNGHWMERVEVALFFTGIFALVFKFLQVRSQFPITKVRLLEVVPVNSQQIEDCPALLDRLYSLPASWQSSYQVQRLRELIEIVQRKNSTDSLDADTKYLSEMDAARASHSYGFVRIVIWALPILGLLGTVIGLTDVIGHLSLEHLNESLPAIAAGLAVAFDTTAIALGFSMVLMFLQYFIDRQENYLLTLVDDRINWEMSGRFEESTTASQDPASQALRRMTETLMQSTEKLVARQAELWQATISAAHSRWQTLSSSAGDQLTSSMGAALEKSLRAHANQLALAEQTAAKSAQENWKQLQHALTRNADSAVLQQQELTKQSEVLLKVVEATGQISQLEQTLNRNLETLSGAKHFEETVLSLAAAVQLLSARMQGASDIRPIELPRTKRAGQAA